MDLLHIDRTDVAHGLASDESLGTCSSCQFPFKVVHYIKRFIREDLHKLVDNCVEKVKLYMAHLIRVSNQRNRIKAIHDGLQPDECLILIDYKMKFEPIYKEGIKLARSYNVL